LVTNVLDALLAGSGGQNGNGNSSPQETGTQSTEPSSGGGLPDGGTPTATEPPPDPKDEQVFRILQESVQADPVEDDVPASDETPYFGEDPVAFAADDVDAASFDVPIADAVGAAADGPIAHGRIYGHYWHDVPDATSDTSGGLFRGRWLAADGSPRGVLRGEYEPLEPEWLPPDLAGGGVFRGKFIDLNGEFRGVIRGRYGHLPGGRNLFFGHWIDADNGLVGVLKGHWKDVPEVNGGRFGGRWAAFNLCGEVDSLPEVLFEQNDFGGFTPTDETVDLTGDEVGSVVVAEQADVINAAGPPCIDPNLPRGFLHGRHKPVQDPGAVGGFFRGRWRSAGGLEVGVLFGRWEPVPPSETSEGAAVAGKFYGKYVSVDGIFRGFVRGVYGKSAHQLDVFRGQYFGAAGVLKGELRGRWVNLPDRPAGPFFGVWYGTDLEAEAAP
jgi:hypothetical protein